MHFIKSNLINMEKDDKFLISSDVVKVVYNYIYINNNSKIDQKNIDGTQKNNNNSQIESDEITTNEFKEEENKKNINNIKEKNPGQIIESIIHINKKNAINEKDEKKNLNREKKVEMNNQKEKKNGIKFEINRDIKDIKNLKIKKGKKIKFFVTKDEIRQNKNGETKTERNVCNIIEINNPEIENLNDAPSVLQEIIQNNDNFNIINLFKRKNEIERMRKGNRFNRRNIRIRNRKRK